MKQADKPKELHDQPDPHNPPHPASAPPPETAQAPVSAPPPGIVQPMIDELRFPTDAPEAPKGPPRGPVHPPQPAELDQDAGGGYNSDHTIPQP